MNDDSQKSNMPDPIDFVPGQKYNSVNSVPPAEQPTKKKGFPKYTLPMIINLVVFFLIQFWVTTSCSSLSDETQGECSSAWLNIMLVWPLEALVFVVCLIILIIGFTRSNK